MQELSLFSPQIQWGMASIAGICLAMMFWLMRRVFTMMNKVLLAFQKNTAAFERLSVNTAYNQSMLREIHMDSVQRRQSEKDARGEAGKATPKFVTDSSEDCGYKIVYDEKECDARAGS